MSYEYQAKDVARFWGHVEKTETCWLWTRAKNNQGYAFFKLGRKMVTGHRFAWTITNGPIPAGTIIDHACRVKLCVNPSHLQAVSPTENSENLSVVPGSNSTGHLNVYKRNNAYGYMVIVRAGGKKHYGGAYRTVEEAAEAARELRNRVKTNNLQDRALES
ncbi:MAG: HNH endonuclease [Actinomycetota bacterium]|nr:HNH endonuclease [Actinomycetota bacterium]